MPSNNIADVPNADEQFLKSLTLDIDETKQKAKALETEIKTHTSDDLKTDETFQYIVEESKDFILSSKDVLEKMGQVLLMMPDPEFAKSYASILQSTASIMRNITDVAASKEKNDTAVKLKEMDIQAKIELKEMDQSIAEIEGPKTVNVIMTREEVMNRLIKAPKEEPVKDKVIDV
jgi:hypothetical protein